MSPPYTLSLLDPVFLGLLALVVASRLVTPRSWHSVIGAVASVAIVGFASPATLALIGGLTLLVLYPLAIGMARLRKAGSAAGRRRALLGFGAVAVLGVWGVVKVNRELDLPALRESGMGAELLGVIGLSYFMLKGINYLWLHYLVEVPNSTPLRALHYALFPPVLTSGPIQKFTEFSREADSPRALDLQTAGAAVHRITKGYFYKVCVAALLYAWVERLLMNEAPNAYQSAGTLGLLYVYFFFDFAGYCHIAIGLALLLGIRVPENFKQPFLATSMTEFWRNWHITLGDWFRDHIFVPLGGMRLGGLRAAALAAGIMVFCGAWHGLSPMLIAWGVWHGANLFLDGVAGVRPMAPAERHGPAYWLRVASTNARVGIGMIFFLPGIESAQRVLEGFLRWP